MVAARTTLDGDKGNDEGGGVMPVLDVLWTMLWVFLFVAWISVVIGVMTDVFRNPDMSGFGKAAWTLVVMLIPWLGVMFYLISNGDGMARRRERDFAASELAAQEYIRQAAGTSASGAGELSLLVDLRDSGVISEQEFAAQKAKVLA